MRRTAESIEEAKEARAADETKKKSENQNVSHQAFLRQSELFAADMILALERKLNSNLASLEIPAASPNTIMPEQLPRQFLRAIPSPFEKHLSGLCARETLMCSRNLLIALTERSRK